MFMMSPLLYGVSNVINAGLSKVRADLSILEIIHVASVCSVLLGMMGIFFLQCHEVPITKLHLEILW